jgi:hypothetical protein
MRLCLLLWAEMWRERQFTQILQTARTCWWQGLPDGKNNLFKQLDFDASL